MELARKIFYILSLAIFAAQASPKGYAETSSAAKPDAQVFVGQDLYLCGPEVISCQSSGAEHSLVFERGFSMSIGGNKYSSCSAVVWLKQAGAEIKATVYLRDEIKSEKSSLAQTAGLQESVIEKDKKVIVEFATSGEIFVTADKRQTSDNREMEIYKEASAAVSCLPKGPRFVVQERALVPQWQEEKPQEEKAVIEEREEAAAVVVETTEPKEEPKAEAAQVKEEKVHYRYPVNLAPAGEETPKIEKFTLADGTEVATVIGRIYVWQKQDESGRLLELQAEAAVVFYTRGKAEAEPEKSESEGVLAGGSVQAIYMTGDVVVTEGAAYNPGGRNILRFCK